VPERLTLFAHVLLPLPVPKSYTYRVPHEWNDALEIGQRVVVQFGPRKIYAGIILDFSDVPPEKYQASYLLEILDEEPIVSPLQLKFWQWISNYYMCHPGEVMAAALPAGFRLQSESVIVLSPEFDEESQVELDEKEWGILSALIKKKSLRLDEAAAIVGLKSPMKYIKSLYTRGIILMHEEVKENYRPKMETFLKLSDAWADESFAKETLEALERRAPKQANVIMAILGMPGSIAPGGGGAAYSR
jgi:primosomal protein N' (replication factor Y)